MAEESSDAADAAVVSLDDVLQENSAREAEARAVLGGSDSKNCTYPKGALARQAVFACATCIPIRMPGVKAAGFCLACSLTCHEGHEIFELYTKREFRCDCGNSRFDEFRCRLYPDKAEENEGNSYNHNFLGNYCTCDRPYPDPEHQDDSIVEENMLQCIVCEDWLHERHLGRPMPEEYEEMVCDSCMKRCQFLHYYSMDCRRLKSDRTTRSPAADPESSASASASAEGKAAASDEQKTPSADSSIESLERLCDLECRQAKSVSPSEQDACKACYFMDGWRMDLCTCAKCLVLYEELNVTFLPDADDTVAAYEAIGVANSPSACSTGSLEDQGMEALRTLPTAHQVEMSTEYNTMKTELSAFLRPFADSGKVVSDDDIRRFFDQLKDRKRRPGDIPPDNCGVP